MNRRSSQAQRERRGRRHRQVRSRYRERTGDSGGPRGGTVGHQRNAAGLVPHYPQRGLKIGPTSERPVVAYAFRQEILRLNATGCVSIAGYRKAATRQNRTEVMKAYWPEKSFISGFHPRSDRYVRQEPEEGAG